MIKAEKLKKARNVILGNKKRLIAIIISLAVVIPSVTYALTINSHNPFVVSHLPLTMSFLRLVLTIQSTRVI
jgi:hypothetical protein